MSQCGPPELLAESLMSLTIHTGSGFRFIIPSHKIAIIVYCQTSLLNSSSTPFRRLQMLNYYDICKLIEAIHPDLEAAWRLKDDVVDFYNENTIDTAEAALNELIQKFYRSGIPEMIKFGRTLRNWKQEIITPSQLPVFVIRSIRRQAKW